MFKNLNRDNNKEAGHTRSGRVFREVLLVNPFKKNYGDECFYSGEEAYLIDEEHLESAREEEGKDEEPRREEPETLGIASTAEVSTIIHPVVLAAIGN
jgi:hypothetical protein